MQTTSSSKLRLGLLGARGVGQAHLHGVADGSDFSIAAVADASDELLGKVQTDFGSADHPIATYHDYRELLDREKLDAVIIALPTFLHGPATLAALDRGLHVLCEKPPTCDLVEMREVQDRVQKTGLVYMFGRQDRFTDKVRAARDMIARGELGPLCGARAEWIRVRGKQLADGGWRTLREKGGGVLLDLGIHGIDTVWFSMGCPGIVEVSASEFTAFRDASENPEGYTADDGAVGWIRFDNGVVLQYQFAFGMNVAGPWKMGQDGAYIRSEDWKACRIYGNHAGIDVYANEKITGPRDHASITKMIDPTEKQPSPFIAQAAEFARAIRENDKPLNSIDHAIQLMQLLSTLRQSADQQRALTLNTMPTNPITPYRQLENAELGYSDTPILPDSGYHVHEGSRPQPPIVTPGNGTAPPSDAIILFDGSNLDQWESIVDGPAPWKIENGYMEVVPQSKNIRTKQHFGRIQLHVEFASPAEVLKKGQGRGNSGIFLMGLYEVQVLDCYENPTYPDGTVGGIYGQYPPLVNVARVPGEWSTYDIIWEPPVFEGARVVRPPFVTVMLNNVIVHHAKELQGPTTHKKLTQLDPHPATGPIMLQDHNDLVRYRNIWVREIGEYDD